MSAAAHTTSSRMMRRRRTPLLKGPRFKPSCARQQLPIVCAFRVLGTLLMSRTGQWSVLDINLFPFSRAVRHTAFLLSCSESRLRSCVLAFLFFFLDLEIHCSPRRCRADPTLLPLKPQPSGFSVAAQPSKKKLTQSRTRRLFRS